MLRPALIATGAVLMTMATPALAYDPCQRAIERAQIARAELDRWEDRHCKNKNPCYYNAYAASLYRAWAAALAEQRRWCS